MSLIKMNVLSILVSVIRSHGNDYFQTYSFLQC